MEIAIYILSTAIVALGVVQVKRADASWMTKILFAMVASMVFMNALDVFVEGNQTVHRQIAYLIQSVIVAALSLQNNKPDKLGAEGK